MPSIDLAFVTSKLGMVSERQPGVELAALRECYGWEVSEGSLRTAAGKEWMQIPYLVQPGTADANVEGQATVFDAVAARLRTEYWWDQPDGADAGKYAYPWEIAAPDYYESPFLRLEGLHVWTLFFTRRHEASASWNNYGEVCFTMAHPWFACPIGGGAAMETPAGDGELWGRSNPRDEHYSLLSNAAPVGGRFGGEPFIDPTTGIGDTFWNLVLHSPSDLDGNGDGSFAAIYRPNEVSYSTGKTYWNETYSSGNRLSCAYGSGRRLNNASSTFSTSGIKTATEDQHGEAWGGEIDIAVYANRAYVFMGDDGDSGSSSPNARKNPVKFVQGLVVKDLGDNKGGKLLPYYSLPLIGYAGPTPAPTPTMSWNTGASSSAATGFQYLIQCVEVTPDVGANTSHSLHRAALHYGMRSTSVNTASFSSKVPKLVWKALDTYYYYRNPKVSTGVYNEVNWQRFYWYIYRTTDGGSSFAYVAEVADTGDGADIEWTDWDSSTSAMYARDVTKIAAAATEYMRPPHGKVAETWQSRLWVGIDGNPYDPAYGASAPHGGNALLYYSLAFDAEAFSSARTIELEGKWVALKKMGGNMLIAYTTEATYRIEPGPVTVSGDVVDAFSAVEVAGPLDIFNLRCVTPVDKPNGQFHILATRRGLFLFNGREAVPFNATGIRGNFPWMQDIEDRSRYDDTELIHDIIRLGMANPKNVRAAYDRIRDMYYLAYYETDRRDKVFSGFGTDDFNDDLYDGLIRSIGWNNTESEGAAAAINVFNHRYYNRFNFMWANNVVAVFDFKTGSWTKNARPATALFNIDIYDDKDTIFPMRAGYDSVRSGGDQPGTDSIVMSVEEGPVKRADWGIGAFEPNGFLSRMDRVTVTRGWGFEASTQYPTLGNTASATLGGQDTEAWKYDMEFLLQNNTSDPNGNFWPPAMGPFELNYYNQRFIWMSSNTTSEIALCEIKYAETTTEGTYSVFDPSDDYGTNVLFDYGGAHSTFDDKDQRFTKFGARIIWGKVSASDYGTMLIVPHCEAETYDLDLGAPGRRKRFNKLRLKFKRRKVDSPSGGIIEGTEDHKAIVYKKKMGSNFVMVTPKKTPYPLLVVTYVDDVLRDIQKVRGDRDIVELGLGGALGERIKFRFLYIGEWPDILEYDNKYGNVLSEDVVGGGASIWGTPWVHQRILGKPLEIRAATLFFDMEEGNG